jgi:hypothetical protein
MNYLEFPLQNQASGSVIEVSLTGRMRSPRECATMSSQSNRGLTKLD